MVMCGDYTKWLLQWINNSIRSLGGINSARSFSATDTFKLPQDVFSHSPLLLCRRVVICCNRKLGYEIIQKHCTEQRLPLRALPWVLTPLTHGQCQCLIYNLFLCKSLQQYPNQCTHNAINIRTSAGRTYKQTTGLLLYGRLLSCPELIQGSHLGGLTWPQACY